MTGVNTHEMDDPRFGLVLGLFGAFGIGLSMMSPNIFWVGAGTCYISCVVTIARYWSNIKTLDFGTTKIRPEGTVISILILSEFFTPSYLVSVRLSESVLQYDLTASFVIPEISAIGTGGLDMNYLMHNSGTKPVLVESIRMIQLVSGIGNIDDKETLQKMDACNDAQRVSPLMFGGLGKLVQTPFALSDEIITPDVVFINLSRVEVGSYQIAPGERVSLKAHFDHKPVDWNSLSTRFVITQICPVIQFVLDDDTRHTVVCAGPARTVMHTTFGNQNILQKREMSYRLLPLSKTKISCPPITSNAQPEPPTAQ